VFAVYCLGHASMGPRFFKRGEYRIDNKTYTQLGCFNGATLFQAWRGYDILQSGADNGQASMGPRFFKRGEANSGHG